MLKSYDELRKIDVRKYCEEREGFLYLNWARCIQLLHENGAEKAYFEAVPNEKRAAVLFAQSRHLQIRARIQTAVMKQGSEL